MQIYIFVLLVAHLPVGWAQEVPAIIDGESGIEAFDFERSKSDWTVHAVGGGKEMTQYVTLSSDKYTAFEIKMAIDKKYDAIMVRGAVGLFPNQRLVIINKQPVLISCRDVFRRASPRKEEHGSVDDKGRVVIYREGAHDELVFMSTCVDFMGGDWIEYDGKTVTFNDLLQGKNAKSGK